MSHAYTTQVQTNVIAFPQDSEQVKKAIEFGWTVSSEYAYTSQLTTIIFTVMVRVVISDNNIQPSFPELLPL